MKQIKFAQLDLTKPAILEGIIDVLDNGTFINGPYGKRFAEAWAYECGASYGVLTANGSAALRAALAAIKLPGHQYVIMPALSFVATAAAVHHSGLTPVYCDVTDDGLMDWDMCKTYIDSLGKSVAAIMPVHLYGQILDVPQDIAQLSLLIEDACQAHGVFALTPRSGSLVCFSFYPSKNLGAAGDAGAVITNLGGLARDMEAFINYGDYPGEKYIHSIIGDNLRCDEIQAAILLKQLSELDSNNAKRKIIAEIYSVNGVRSIATAKINAWHLYPILAQEPDKLRSIMSVKGIETGRHYPYVLPQVVKGLSGHAIDRAERIARHVVTLPIGPHMDVDDTAHVVSILIDIAQLTNGLWELKI